MRTKGRKNTPRMGQCGCVIGEGTLMSLGVEGIVFSSGLDLPYSSPVASQGVGTVTETNQETISRHIQLSLNLSGSEKR